MHVDFRYCPVCATELVMRADSAAGADGDKARLACPDGHWMHWDNPVPVLAALVELAPQDAARIEQVAARLFAEAGQDSAAFHERSARSLQRVGGQLAAWNRDGRHDAAIRRLQTGLGGVCGKLDAADPQRATCEALLKSALKSG